MKTIEQLLDCIEDDIELMGENHIIYLMEEDKTVVDYDYLPSADYAEAVTLAQLKTELSKKLACQKIEKESPKRLAVVFPGVGYTCDKPLLYYSTGIVKKLGYEIIKISYHDLPENIKGNPELKRKAFEAAISSAKEQLNHIDWNRYEDILFLSKSVGTIVSSAYAKMNQLKVRNVLYTPVQETFQYAGTDSVAFHGLLDDWTDSPKLQSTAKEQGICMYLTKDANHSLETGDLKTDLRNLQTIMEQTERFILKI